jgi:hypothetical protein
MKIAAVRVHSLVFALGGNLDALTFEAVGLRPVAMPTRPSGDYS